MQYNQIIEISFCIAAEHIHQPDLEFIETKAFGFKQTGSRSIPGLNVTFSGTGPDFPTFNSYQRNSELFGDALSRGENSYVFFE